MASHPRYAVPTYGPPRTGWWHRLIADCRDLWKLIRGRTEERVDPHFGSRMAVELAKLNPVIYPDLDKWEGEQFAFNPLAFWFDPERYVGTKWDFKKRDHVGLSDLQAQLKAQGKQSASRSSGFAKGGAAPSDWHAPMRAPEFVPCDPNESIKAQLERAQLLNSLHSAYLQHSLMNAQFNQAAHLQQQSLMGLQNAMLNCR